MTAGLALSLLLALAFAALALRALWRARAVTTIYPPHVGLLYRDGRFVRELPPGRYARFDPFRRTRVVPVSLAEQPSPHGEVTVLSKDQFSFRLGFAPVVRVTDARAYHEASGDGFDPEVARFMPAGTGHAALGTWLSAAALEAVAERTLAEVLADAGAVAASMQARLAGTIPGATVPSVLLTAVNLPPETRKMFTDVERARFEAQAALERARGEQASLRVLANAARLVHDNPALANLRLLQAVENGRGQTTIVLGNAAAPVPGLGPQVPPAPGDDRAGAA